MSEVTVKTESRAPAALLVQGSLLFLLLAGLTLLYDWQQRVLPFLGLALAAFVPFALAARTALRSGGADRLSLLIVVGFAVLFRAVLLPTPPRLSDDMFRYLWEGRVLVEGENPFALAPDAPELAPLRDEIWQGVNNKPITTIYPPVSQLLFFAMARAGGGILAMKAVLCVLDLAVVGVLMWLLRARDRNPLHVVLYAWNPLVLVEVAGSGHNDPLALLFLLLAIGWLGSPGRPHLAVGAVALGGLAKIVPFLLVPVLLLRRVPWVALLWLPGLVVLAYLPFAGAGEQLFFGTTQYAERWRHNDFLFAGLLETIAWIAPDLPDHLVRRVAKAAVATFLVGLTGVLVVRRVDPLRSAFVVLASVFALTPTLHPWYLLWVAPFLVFFPSPAWLYLTASVLLSYLCWLPDASGKPAWTIPGWVSWLEWGPWVALLALGLLRLRHRRNGLPGRPLEE